MCLGGGGAPKVKSYEPAKDPTTMQDSARASNKAKLAALYGMSQTNKTGGMGVKAPAATAGQTAFAKTMGGA